MKILFITEIRKNNHMPFLFEETAHVIITDSK
jgi:hypothetical protein